jgi:phytoene desaturase
MQTQDGIWYPRGGTRAVPVALTKLGGELGVDYRNKVEITRLTTDSRNKKVTGVVTSTGEKYDFDVVVSNSDTVRTHRELLEDVPAAKKFENRRSYEPACSGVVLYLGLDRRYEQLLHHNFVFSKDPHVEFEQIYREGKPAEDPTAYLCAPAISEPEVAIPGGEALYILVHTPYLRPGHNWTKMLPEYRQVILKKLETCAGMKDIEKHIVYESALTPQSIHDRYRVLNGAIYGLASHGKWAGAFKPANRSPDLEGLYFAGGSAHPGPGMPMALMSGWIAGDVVDQDARMGDPKPIKGLSAASL